MSNSGFTLTELLVGLIMGSIVIGGLGWGLLQLLKTTQKGTAETAAHNDSSRALDFISDEIKRASEIENTAANARTGTGAGQFDDTDTGKTVVFALNIPEVNTSATLGADNNDTTSERIVYYLEAASNNWKGPQVFY
ncbi:MAG: PilW family protein [Pleurocapsa sp.]